MEATHDSPHPLLAGVVLAAGAARRFGGAKPLALVDGETLLARTVRRLGGTCGAGVWVVTGCRHAAVAAAVPPGAHPVYHPGWASGMAGSLRRAIHALPPVAMAVLVMPCDLPQVTAADIARLAAAWRRQPSQPAAACFDGRRGAPAILPRRWWTALHRLRGDEGARAILAAVHGVAGVDMPAAALDVDTPGDLQRLAGNGA